MNLTLKTKGFFVLLSHTIFISDLISNSVTRGMMEKNPIVESTNTLAQEVPDVLLYHIHVLVVCVDVPLLCPPVPGDVPGRPGDKLIHQLHGWFRIRFSHMLLQDEKEPLLRP